ncbi:hypothetical protein LU11_gp115 [Pseudomonas phage Lu11]|uniref:hypothetical protein n=1 Tax=Pseudomonas phage Lu11 TaxID=1161927 RepID=UPI00025F154D|nr:hypothetical protein LU11_gp115 [Pseudomonas phage Lu11]AFH14646.1 hypothetical protein Lu11_0114 [Pseudomonas phage Lu11]
MSNYEVICDETNNTPEDVENNNLNVDITLHGMGAIVVPSETGPKNTVTYPRVVEDTPERKITQLSEDVTLITDSYREPQKPVPDVWDSLIDEDCMRDELRIKARILRTLNRWIKASRKDDVALCTQLMITHEDLADLRAGHIDEYCIGTLMEYCTRAGITKLDEYL